MTRLRPPKFLTNLWGRLRNQPELDRLRLDLRAAERAREDAEGWLEVSNEACDVYRSDAEQARAAFANLEEHTLAVECLLRDAIASVVVLQTTLLERQAGILKDPSDVIRLFTDEPADKRRTFIPLKKRRRMALRVEQAKETLRGAVLAKPTLPHLPLSTEAMEIARAAVAHLPVTAAETQAGDTP